VRIFLFSNNGHFPRILVAALRSARRRDLHAVGGTIALVKAALVAAANVLNAKPPARGASGPGSHICPLE
jgi:hypothetical protein